MKLKDLLTVLHDEVIELQDEEGDYILKAHQDILSMRMYFALDNEVIDLKAVNTDNGIVYQIMIEKWGDKKMIKDTNLRIAITLTKEQVEDLNKISQKTGYSKSTLIKMAVNRLIQQDYVGLITWKE